MPNIIFSVMQKPFIKCLMRQRVGRFLHSRKNLLGVLKKRQYYSPFCVPAKVTKLIGLKNNRILSPINLVTFAGTQKGQ
jgi:hypothetical protein